MNNNALTVEQLREALSHYGGTLPVMVEYDNSFYDIDFEVVEQQPGLDQDVLVLHCTYRRTQDE